MAKTILDEKYEEGPVKLGDTVVYCVGRIGSVIVAISCLPGPPDSASFEDIVQNMVTIFSSIQSIIVIGFGCEIPGASFLPGDLAISLSTRHYGDVELSSTHTPNVVQRAFRLLQGEVGKDGHWLSSDLSSALSNHKELPKLVQGSNDDLPGYPHIHYEKICSDLQNVQTEKSQGQLVAAIKFKRFDAIAGTSAGTSYEISYLFSMLTSLGVNLSIPRVVVLGVSNNVDSHQSNDLKGYTAAYATLYAKEFTQMVSDNVMLIIPNLKNSEKVVPPHNDPILPRFPPHRFPSYGNTVLLVIPTANESKRRLLEDSFIEQAPENVVLRTVIVPVDSEVGEQPYNDAGIIGAYNRINNALIRLDTAEYEKILREKNIGTVIVASIESYIQVDDVDRPTDYGVVVVYNATTQQTAACSSWGVTIPLTFVDRAPTVNERGRV